MSRLSRMKKIANSGLAQGQSYRASHRFSAPRRRPSDPTFNVNAGWFCLLLRMLTSWVIDGLIFGDKNAEIRRAAKNAGVCEGKQHPGVSWRD